MQAPRQASRRRVGQHAKGEAGWEEERTGGGAVERGEDGEGLWLSVWCLRETSK